MSVCGCAYISTFGCAETCMHACVHACVNSACSHFDQGRTSAPRAVQSAATAANRASLRPVSTTLIPGFASAMASPAPIPLLPPVISTDVKRRLGPAVRRSWRKHNGLRRTRTHPAYRRTAASQAKAIASRSTPIAAGLHVGPIVVREG